MLNQIDIKPFSASLVLVLLACSVDFKFASYHRECAADLALATTKVGSFFGLSSLTLWWARLPHVLMQLL
jgi:hypothetical protein